MLKTVEGIYRRRKVELIEAPENVRDQCPVVLSDSVIVAENLATILQSEIRRGIGKLPMIDINNALRYTLGH